jgi:hypothetical protein
MILSQHFLSLSVLELSKANSPCFHMGQTIKNKYSVVNNIVFMFVGDVY